MTIVKEFFGTVSSGETVYKFILTNNNGNQVSVLNYGCIIQSIIIKDKMNQPVDVVMGFDRIEDYNKAGGFVGALVGRCANRINNATFQLNGETYNLNANENNNHLHGGKEGFSKKVFEYSIDDKSVNFSYLSPDQEENYPGNLKVDVKYTWTDSNELICQYHTCPDQDTVVNLTNHSYFDLNGVGSGHALDQNLKINARYMTPVNEKGLLTGEITCVDNTCFDFNVATSIRDKWKDNENQIIYANGYDHNYVLSSSKNSAILYGSQTGITMQLSTSSPGLQLYTGNYLRDSVGKEQVVYGKHTGVCLEPQFFPNSINFSHFPSPIQYKNNVYIFETIYSFNNI